MLPRTLALGLGSNLGSSLDHLRTALSELKQLSFFKIKNVSSIYESDALLPEKASPDWNLKYLNAVVLVELVIDKNPLDLLSEIKKIESKMGRESVGKWAPRVIDIDILAWNGENFTSQELNIPHASLKERPFALLPLLQVWPQYRLSLSEAPHWAQAWVQEKPFNTQISQKFFWPRLVGILNITPDSFSDGGNLLFDEKKLILQLEKLSHEGAEIIDVGAESTRPMAAAVSSEEELKRLSWALDIVKKYGSHFKVSIDCRKPEVLAEIFKRYKVDFINDVSGLQNKGMIELAKSSRLPVFVMHSLDVPAQPQNSLSDIENPCRQLNKWWGERVKLLTEQGLAPEQLIFDPGIGFGKTKSQSIYILNHLDQFAEVQQDMMLGYSRKSYQTLFSNRKAGERDLETALSTFQLNLAFTQFLRVHDIETQRLALQAGVLDA